MTRGMVLQSSQNWTGSSSRHWHTTAVNMLFPWILAAVYCSSSLLVSAMEGHERRNDSTVPWWDAFVPQQVGRVQRPSLFQTVQWQDKASTLYLPDRRRAWHTAFSTSHGEEPHNLNRGWQEVSPMKLVCRYFRERSHGLRQNHSPQILPKSEEWEDFKKKKTFVEFYQKDLKFWGG